MKPYSLCSEMATQLLIGCKALVTKWTFLAGPNLQRPSSSLAFYFRNGLDAFSSARHQVGGISVQNKYVMNSETWESGSTFQLSYYSGRNACTNIHI